MHSIVTNVNIKMAVDSQHDKLVKENRKRLVPIVKTVILCGKIGVAYRAKANPTVAGDSLVAKDGNFDALLEFRVDAGDTDLENHLKTAGRNATYISPRTQNEIIEICGDLVSESIIKEVTQYWTLLADKTTDSSQKEQLCVCIRYVVKSKEGYCIKGQFIKFQNATDLKCAELAEQLISIVSKLGLRLRFCVGQGYDGASSMSGHTNGCQAKVREQAPYALYVHCSSHTLNLVLNSSSRYVGCTTRMCKVYK